MSVRQSIALIVEWNKELIASLHYSAMLWVSHIYVTPHWTFIETSHFHNLTRCFICMNTKMNEVWSPFSENKVLSISPETQKT
jgi:hypothetical protein